MYEEALKNDIKEFEYSNYENLTKRYSLLKKYLKI